MAKQTFEIPEVWLTERPLLDVQYFNVNSGEYDITDNLTDFTQESVVKVVNGLTIFTVTSAPAFANTFAFTSSAFNNTEE